MGDKPTNGEALADERLDAYRADDNWRHAQATWEYANASMHLRTFCAAIRAVQRDIETGLDEDAEADLEQAAMRTGRV